MKVEAGKYYRTRDGRKVGPMGPTRRNEDAQWKWQVPHMDKPSWKDNGRQRPLEEDALDLIAEWTDEPTGPVRTRTVTEIVPGLYGRVALTASTYCDNGDVAVGLTPKFGGEAKFMHINAAELRAAAAIFIQLADALEGGAE